MPENNDNKRQKLNRLSIEITKKLDGLTYDDVVLVLHNVESKVKHCSIKTASKAESLTWFNPEFRR